MVFKDGRPEERARHIGRMIVSIVRFLAAMVMAHSFVRRKVPMGGDGGMAFVRF